MKLYCSLFSVLSIKCRFFFTFTLSNILFDEDGEGFIRVERFRVRKVFSKDLLFNKHHFDIIVKEFCLGIIKMFSVDIEGDG